MTETKQLESLQDAMDIVREVRKQFAMVNDVIWEKLDRVERTIQAEYKRVFEGHFAEVA